MKFRTTIIFVGLALISMNLFAQLPEATVSEWQNKHQSKSTALEEFNDAKFGLFIHWGLYSEPAGEWKGQKLPGLSEWIQYHAMIPKSDYHKLAEKFNPEIFIAEQWVLAAKAAGMKYIVITSKHHDGFSMYDTKFSDYSITNATPFKRDPVDELYRACKKHGLRFGVYYSQIIDWNDGWDGGMYRADRKMNDMDKGNPMNTWDPNKITREEYLQNKAYPQVKELITKYPDMLEVWFDYWYEGSGDRYCTPDISYNFYKTLYEVSPKCLVSSRIGSGLGDFAAAGDNEILTDSKMAYWETPGTVNNTWGYSKFDNDWKTPEELIFWMVDIASKGGNYLLNVGPKADGTIPAHSLELLSEMGKWMQVNGEAIYGTKKWTVDKEGPNTVAMKGTDDREKDGFKANFSNEDFWFTQKGNTVYAISLAKPGSKTIIKSLNTSIGKVSQVELLGNKAIRYKQAKKGLDVIIPEDFKSQYGYVLKVTLSATTRKQQQPELLFQSGFEDNCSVVKFGNSNHSITGEDKKLKMKSDWDADMKAIANTVHLNYTGGDSTKRYAAIISEPGNPKNKVLQFRINEGWSADRGYQKARVQQELYDIKTGLKEFSQSVRIFLPEDMRTVQKYPKEIKWLTIMEFWNNITWSESVPFGFRITLGMGKQSASESELNFILDAQDCELFPNYKQIYTTLWEAHNDAVKVPIGEWFTLHYYYKEGDKNNGRFEMSIETKSKGRQKVFDITNITYNSNDPNPDGVTHFNPMKMYTSADLANFMKSQCKALQIYWDDLKIWKGKSKIN